MAEKKYDRVDRNKRVIIQGTTMHGAVILPIDCPYAPGEIVVLRDVVEQEIDCNIRDANDMTGGVGDAVFDASLTDTNNPNICDANIDA